ncbi:hypothetical protein TNCV_3898971 [Trichonephila clavipes]|nr:hypothetical protein TNCV_3898971 [Trichonephila clavipes]
METVRVASAIVAPSNTYLSCRKQAHISNQVVELLDDCNVDVPSWKYPRSLESPRVSSPGFGNDSKMMVMNGTGGKCGTNLQPPESVVSASTAHKTFGPIDLTSTYSMCCQKVVGGILHRTQAFLSGVRCSNSASLKL